VANDSRKIRPLLCNTVRRPKWHATMSGFRSPWCVALKRYAERPATQGRVVITADYGYDGAAGLVRVHRRKPKFPGRPRRKLVSVEATKLDGRDRWFGDQFLSTG